MQQSVIYNIIGLLTNIRLSRLMPTDCILSRELKKFKGILIIFIFGII